MKADTPRNYPREIDLKGSRVTLRLMSGSDGSVALAFARALPAHDLLFLRRDITQPEAIEIWLNGRSRRIIVVAACGGASRTRLGRDARQGTGPPAHPRGIRYRAWVGNREDRGANDSGSERRDSGL
jgi:hypothetical protein